MVEPVPALDVPLGEQQEQLHSLKEDKPGLLVNTARWPPPARTRTTTGSADSPGMIRQGKILNQVQGPSGQCSQKEQKMGLETKLPVTQVSGSTQEVRLETGAAQA